MKSRKACFTVSIMKKTLFSKLRLVHVLSRAAKIKSIHLPNQNKFVGLSLFAQPFNRSKPSKIKQISNILMISLELKMLNWIFPDWNHWTMNLWPLDVSDQEGTRHRLIYEVNFPIHKWVIPWVGSPLNR